jgi:hypothetical protein
MKILEAALKHECSKKNQLSKKFITHKNSTVTLNEDEQKTSSESKNVIKFNN